MSASWIDEPRHGHVDNVRPIRRDVTARHPSQFYDRADEDQGAATCVLLTTLEAQLIASLLRSARARLPSPKACDAAIALLVPTPGQAS